MTTQRTIIKIAMAQLNQSRYRITAGGELHFYGCMPNTIIVGWWLAAQDAQQFVDALKNHR